MSEAQGLPQPDYDQDNVTTVTVSNPGSPTPGHTQHPQNNIGKHRPASVVVRSDRPMLTRSSQGYINEAYTTSSTLPRSHRSGAEVVDPREELYANSTINKGYQTMGSDGSRSNSEYIELPEHIYMHGPAPYRMNSYVTTTQPKTSPSSPFPPPPPPLPGAAKTTDQAQNPAPITVLHQPTPTRNFDHTWLDTNSLQLLQGAVLKHKSSDHLKETVQEEGLRMQSMTWGNFTSLQDNLNYEQLLQGLKLSGEEVVVSTHWLYYTSVEFKDYNNDQILKTLGNGRAVLTNFRVLLMSAEDTAGASFSQFGVNPKRPPGGYYIEVSRKDVVHYQPIPLRAFKSVELHADMGARTGVNIYARAPCLCGCCRWYWPHCKACDKTWLAGNPVSHTYNSRTMTLGVALPPSNKICAMTIHLHPQVPLSIATEFISHLQTYSPELHSA